VLLLAPPFDRGTGDPGYIKGYPPGIRENGAQYTHAATWAVWAAARLGDGERAMSLFRLLNPILRCQDALGVQRYRVEPYVLSGDIYSVPPHTGRGGWSWYSGAAAWLYRAGVEVLLGLKQLGNELEVSPCLPPEWEGYRARLRRGSSWYRLEVSKPPGVSCGEPVIVKDGKRIEGRRIPFLDDGVDHAVEVTLQPAGDWEIDTGQP
jgi:cyclic beta-1,2-glucan synthetase